MLRKRNQVYHVQFWMNRKLLSRSTGQTDRRLAERAAREILRLARLRTMRPEESQRLEEAIVLEIARIEQDVSSRQAQRTEISLLAFREFLAGNPPLMDITTGHLLQFQRSRLAAGAARDTVRKDLTAVVRLFRQNGCRVDRPPAPISGAFHPNRAFTDDELEKLAAHTAQPYRVLYAALLATGARLAELVPSKRSSHTALLKTEVDPLRGALSIRMSKCRPGSRSEVRQAPVSAELLKLLQRQMAQVPGPHVFPPFTALSRSFDKALRRAGIPKINELSEKLTLHSFRHTRGTQLAQIAGDNPFLVQKALGHKQIGTTARYCHPQPPDLTGTEAPFLRQPVADRCQNRCQIIELEFGKAG